jgi:NAD+ diphosphatase
MFELNYCPQCGQKLTKKELPLDGLILIASNAATSAFQFFPSLSA